MVAEAKRTWTENKFLMSVCGVIMAGLIAWGIWVTKGVFASQFNETTLRTMCDDVDKMKKIDEALKLNASVLEIKFDNQTLKMEMNQKEIRENQIAIMRELRRR